MEYMDLCGNNVSRLGFGCMRLPEVNDMIDYKEAMNMADYAIKNGVNYFDTAYIYHEEKSEGFVKEVIKKYGRSNLFIADKLPIYNCEKESDLEKYLNIQLDRLGTDYIDYYLFHCLNVENYGLMKKFNYKEFIKNNVGPDKKIRHIGFSFHDELPLFKEIIDDYAWEFTQIQLNYLDTSYQAGLEGYEYAKNKNIPVIIMEPIRGGRLAAIPKKVRRVFDGLFVNDSDAEIALRFVGNYSNNRVILSGMHRMSDLDSNIKLFSTDLINKITDKEAEAYSNAKKEFEKYSLINCTACDYCKEGCPCNIPISEIFSKYNKHIEGEENNKNWYNSLSISASHCIKCGNCESVCPQGLSIMDNLEKIHDYFDN